MHGSSHSGGWPSRDLRPCAVPCSLELVSATIRPDRWRLASEKGVRHQRGLPSVTSCCARAVADGCHRARVPLAAVDAFGRQVLRPPYWSRPKPRSGRSSAALVRRIACGGRAARLPPDGCSTPVRVRRGPWRGGSGRVQADARAREGPLTPSPGLGLLPTVQLAGPMPRDMPLQCIRGYNEALCAKMNVSDPARRRPSLQSMTSV